MNLDLMTQSGHKEVSGIFTRTLWLNFPRPKYDNDSKNDGETRQRVQHRLGGMRDVGYGKFTGELRDKNKTWRPRYAPFRRQDTG